MVYIFWISKNFFVEKSPSPKKHQLSFIISKVIISRSAPPFLPKQGLSSSIPPGKFNFYNEIVTSFCIFFNLSDRFSYLKKEPPRFGSPCLPNTLPTHWGKSGLKNRAKRMSTKCLPNTAPKPLGGGQFEKAGKVSVYQMSTNATFEWVSGQVSRIFIYFPPFFTGVRGVTRP